ncbi:ComF family protein [Fodinibius halophilus]|uniref:ComF family protein n=1 Tax=Fodinibius halophilus TaxID=1736908 RepID=A0A6M1T4Q1_9BACT|nr:phosphoribosyltransferase family protein [Fodinibius halophilus]NGP88225.1 ComF family protein [Fodinibius halophilus]
MIPIFRYISEGLSQVEFPNVCVCCGHENTRQEHQLCSFCLDERFEDANPENERASSDTLLPEGVEFQLALWQFDKGGVLQDLLHQLKYHRLTTIGHDLGRKLGERVALHPSLNAFLKKDSALLLPVPLHYLKYRYRGFNQAFKIAKGFQEGYKEIPICNIDDVIRHKYTHTQTGFSLDQRLRNMEGAFEVNNTSVIKDKVLVIIDDVFTTGATTFELCRTVQRAGAKSVIILTVAQA